MQGNNLVFASPESLGIPSGAIHAFLQTLEALRHPMHSFLLLRHGKVAAEGYWPPFDENRRHRMYSVSKSFTSVAVGMLIDEGKLKLTDRVADIFPEYVPENAHRYTLEATVEDLLRMATCNEGTSYTSKDPNFVESFFTDKNPKHKPGAFFHYDTAGTTVLCGAVEKLAGMPILGYMRPVLNAIGISKDIDCILAPEGGSWTGSGVLCTPRDLARFAMLCMNQGAWEGKQLVSKAYMQAATSKQIDNSVARSASGVANGYGYQFWMLRDGGFGCFGMGNQFAFCMPKYDAILVTTADTQAVSGAEDELLAAFYALLGKMSDFALPEDTLAQAILHKHIAALALPLPCGAKTTARAFEFSGKTYDFEENLYGFRWMRVEITDDICTLHYENPTGVHTLRLGMGRYEAQLFPELYYGKKIGTRDRHYQTIAAGAWAADDALVGTLYAVDDYLGTLKMQLTFYQDELCVFMTKAAEDFFNEYRGYLAGHARG